MEVIDRWLRKDLPKHCQIHQSSYPWAKRLTVFEQFTIIVKYFLENGLHWSWSIQHIGPPQSSAESLYLLISPLRKDLEDILHSQWRQNIVWSIHFSWSGLFAPLDFVWEMLHQMCSSKHFNSFNALYVIMWYIMNLVCSFYGILPPDLPWKLMWVTMACLGKVCQQMTYKNKALWGYLQKAAPLSIVNLTDKDNNAIMDLLVEGLDGSGRMLRLLLHIFNVGTQFGRVTMKS
jgi:hypothetical protein